MVDLPATFADITVEWFDAAIREGGLLDVSIAAARVEPMDPSKGLIGDLAAVHVTYSRGSGPTSFVVKLPAANPDSRAIGNMLNAYGREVAFYRHVAPRSPGTRLPVCYYAGEDLSTNNWVLVLELIEADAFDFFAGATPDQATAAIDALAHFHAIWWQSPERFDWMPGFDVSGVGGLQPLWLNNLPAFIERYGDVLPEPTPAWVLAFAPNLIEWSSGAANEPLTMVHSDYRIDNLLFQGDQVTMIDWQTAMRAPAAMDVSCFIITSLGIDARRRDEGLLIERYLNQLATGGVTVDRAWFMESYDQNILWWMGQFGNNLAHLTTENEQVQAGLTSMVERVYIAALDRNVGRLL